MNTFLAHSGTIFNLLCIIYIVEIVNNNKSDELLINNGVSDFIWLYEIHNDDEIIFIIENTNEYGLVDFLVYNKYIKINLPDMEIEVAEYAMINSIFIIWYVFFKCAKYL